MDAFIYKPLYTKTKPGVGPVEQPTLVARIFMPNLGLFVEADREATRNVLAETFSRMCKCKARCRFDDECELCWRVKEHQGSGFLSCTNHECPNGGPPMDELRALVKEFPYRKTELACDYMDRLEAVWRERHRSK